MLVSCPDPFRSGHKNNQMPLSPGYSVMSLRSTHSPTSLSPAPVHAGCVASACPPGSWISVPPASAPDLQASHNNFATHAQNDGGCGEKRDREDK